jgi:hypothetical protein
MKMYEEIKGLRIPLKKMKNMVRGLALLDVFNNYLKKYLHCSWNRKTDKGKLKGCSDTAHRKT